MNLYYVQDGDNPMHVAADSWEHAVDRWRLAIAFKFGEDMEGEEPQGIQLVAEEEDLDIAAADQTAQFRERVFDALMKEIDNATSLQNVGAIPFLKSVCCALDLPTQRDDSVPF